MMTPSPPSNALGEFLRACRDRVAPESVGLDSATLKGRRVPGLRREEVAALSGVSIDYFTRLEQGRERRPSLQTVNALARLFRLDRDQRLHLARLADAVPAISFEETRPDASPGLVELLSAWPHTPAVVFNAAYDPIARNELGAALFRPFGSANLALSVFLDPEAREFYIDWPTVARNTAGALRLSTGASPEDPRLHEIVNALRHSSAEFARIWADRSVTGKTSAAKSFSHPQVGRLDLTMQAFDVRGAPGQELIVYHAEAGSASADALQMLGFLNLDGTPASDV